ncbi:hypothetical protein CF15_03510 [Pyrodictium occultum]|uniref:Uncharacterized protein n=1 Tax=Pyrodictium occultum TaxID=2309 RepID=A0A0V8RUY9_PYROC|nr:hypothetical protein [Pyrodictium occultum]KSW11879.1 hypothetical protein CF15_03510 [Pyrodictium occultum]
MRIGAYRRRVPERGGLDAAILVGAPPASREAARLGKLGYPVYSLPGRGDDHYLARLLSAHSVSVEGHLAYQGQGVYIAGVGGREPLANLQSLDREIREAKPARLILATEYPPHGLFDASGLGVSRGLFELLEAVEKWRPEVVVIGGCSSPGAASIGGILYVCLGRRGCSALIELGEEVDALVECPGTGSC